MTTRTVRLRALSRFGCLADRCPETCCTGLRVPVSQARLEHLRTLTADGPFAETVATTIHQAHGEDTATITMQPDGACPFFGADRLCGLQKAHGAEALPDICASFPRVSWQVGAEIEASGTMACPEVARQILLTHDGVIPEEAGVDACAEITARVTDDPARSVQLRSGLQALLRNTDLPLSSRLAVAAHLGFALQQQQEEVVAESLGQIVSAFSSGTLSSNIHKKMSGLTLPVAPTLGVFASVLRSRLRAGRGPRFDALVDAVLQSYRLQHEGGAIDAAAAYFQERAAWAQDAWGAHLQTVFDRACEHELFRFPVSAHEGVLSFVLRLALKLGVVKTLVLGHPAIVAAFEQRGEEAIAPDALDAALVDCFQLVARHLEQSPEWLALIAGLKGGAPEEWLGRTLVFAAY